MKPHLRAFLILLATVLATVVQAHDPYEITGTASVLSNRFEITAVFEYRAARLLTGRGWATNQVDEALEFAVMKSELETAAEKFFQISTAEKILPLNSIAAELGVENHITLTFKYPAIGETPVTISAPGLVPLTAEGQYGVGLTVLDMVRKKVLGQHVFSAENPGTPATFAPAAAELATEQKIVEKVAPVTVPIKSAAQNELPKAETSAQKKPLLWPWFIAAAAGALVAWRLSRSK